ncbi:MAG: enoyl-CoA hydratase-related protein [Caldimonas sp.]
MLVLSSREGSTLLLTFNRPDAGNAMSVELALELKAALAVCREDASIRSVVVTGAGDRYFCTGGDVKRYAKLDDAAELNQAFDTVRDLLDEIEALEQPVFAALNGFTVGGGTEFALACDLRFAARSVQMGLPHVRLGLIPGWDGTARLVELVGRAHAMRLMLSGERITADEALRIGLVNQVTDDGRCVEVALAFAAKLDVAAPLAIGAAKRTVLESLRCERSLARRLGRERFAELWFTEDHKEAELAFAQKRTPRFS